MTLPGNQGLRVVFVTQYWPPEAHGAIPRLLARGLAERGHTVRVVTTFPNHPSGTVFPGWRQRLRHVERDGDVLVRRVPMIPDHSRRASARFLAYCSFAVSSCTATASVRGADVVLVHCAQPTAALPAVLWKRLFGIPYVLHVQDLWPESVTDSGMLGRGLRARLVRRGILVALRWLHRDAARVIAIAPRARQLLVERGADPSRTTVCLNAAADQPDTSLRARASGRGTTVVYAGSLGDAQGLDVVVRAAAACRDLDGFRVDIVGDGTHRAALVDLADRLGADNVAFRPAVPRSRMPEVHASADFELVVLRDTPMATATIPSKFQDAMAFAVPVIVSAPGDVAELVRRSGVGSVARPGDVGDLAAAFRRAHRSTADERRALRGAARAFAERHLSVSATTDHVEDVLRGARA
jgi:colanic acid biosynthesis glycosyl transferase WcaI